MANTIKTVEQPTVWDTLDDAIEQELCAPAGDHVPADWFQDCAEYSLPKECMPNWRTVH